MLETALQEAPAGVIVGGWKFVVAAYSITAAGLAGYAISLFRRSRKAALPDAAAKERA
ncbi:MAG: hypothetical protein ABI639_16155 [Thermoanaerobaculia bacterium]